MSRIYGATMALVVGALVAGCNGNQGTQVTQAAEVNLAGCEVPVGTKRADAEAIKCDNAVEPAPAEQSASGDAVLQETVEITPDAEVIDAAIAEAAKKSDGATEYRDARKSLEGDLTGDTIPEVVVLYTLEGEGGGNGNAAYLAAFLRDPSGQLTLVGTTSVAGWGVAVKDISLKDEVVHLNLLVQGPDDPDCCPTTEEKVQYVFHGGKWLQVQGEP